MIDKLTPEQRGAALEIARAIDQGGARILLNAPTGAGKTLIALAAIKQAHCAGKIALAAPTRLLAAQHAVTSGITLDDMRSGLWTALKRSDGDLVVGTHAILSYPGRFDLVVIDEEQRFGADIKAKLEAKADNVLYLSATPIPRTTVHLPLDLVVVEGVPFDRPKPKVRVGRYRRRIARRMIRDAIARGGQAIVIHHPIRELQAIQRQFPDVRSCILHGKMDEGELLRVGEAFRAGEYDLLVATTVVESGLDIPRVDTLITDCAHLFGLAQLHQLVGRVGRAGQQGYVYLGYRGRPPYPAIWRMYACNASSRRVAVWDVRLRGSGVPQGPQQHGKTYERAHLKASRRR